MEPDLDDFDGIDDDPDVAPRRHSWKVRWAAIVILAAMVLSAASSLIQWW